MDSMPSPPSAVSLSLFPFLCDERMPGIWPFSIFSCCKTFCGSCLSRRWISTYTASLSNKPHANSSSNIFHVQNVDMPQKFNNTLAQHSPTNASEQGGGLTANVHDEKPWKYHVFHRFQSEIETFGKVSLQGVFSWHGLQKVPSYHLRDWIIGLIFWQQLLDIAQGFQTRWNLLWGNVLKPHDSAWRAAYEMGSFGLKCWRVFKELLDMVVECGNQHYHPHLGAYSGGTYLPNLRLQKYSLDSLVSLGQKCENLSMAQARHATDQSAKFDTPHLKSKGKLLKCRHNAGFVLRTNIHC